MTFLAKQKKKQSNALVWIILLIIVGAALWYYLKQPAPPAPVENATAATGIAKGDLVAIDFTLTTADGTVIGTNNETLAREYHLKNYATGPFRFIVGQSGMVKGFDDAILGMELGGTATKVIPPSEPVLELTLNKTRRVVRNQPYRRFHTLSPAKFERAFGKKPTAGLIVSNASLPWPFRVVNATNDTVVIEASVKEGETLHLPGYEWNSSIVIIAGNSVLVRHNPADGQIIATDFGPGRLALGDAIMNITYQVNAGDVITYHVPVMGAAAMPYQFKVTQASDRKFVLRRIDYPAQETLTLTARITERTPHVKEVKAPLKTKESY